MDTVYYEKVNSSLCNLLVAYTKEGLTRVKFNVKDSEIEFFEYLKKHFEKIIKENSKSDYGKELEAYLNSDKKDLDLPVSLIGTEFNKKVWKELMNVPFGELKTYKQIAEAVGCEKGYRAVGNANNKNPIVIVVPCHRIIGSEGALTGFAPGIQYKVDILKHEGHIPYMLNNKWYVDIKNDNIISN